MTTREFKLREKVVRVFVLAHLAYVGNWDGPGLSQRVPRRPPLLLVLGHDSQDLALMEREVVGVLNRRRTKKESQCCHSRRVKEPEAFSAVAQSKNPFKGSILIPFPGTE